MLANLEKLDLAATGRTVLSGAPEGLDAEALGGLAARGTVLHVARDDARMQRLADQLAFFHPDLRVLQFPAWDCLPYDRVSPNPEIVAERAAVLSTLAAAQSSDEERPALILTTVSAVLQRVPPRQAFSGGGMTLAPGTQISLDRLTEFLAANGYVNAGTVREAGEFAVRGGIVDLFAPGADAPVRVDFFGDEIESLRRFDPVSQKSEAVAEHVILYPARELILSDERIKEFRTGYRARFKHDVGKDVLYQTVSEGRPFNGMEHWLPLFFPGTETLFDYVGPDIVTLDDQTDSAVEARLELIADYHQARVDGAAHQGAIAGEEGFVYHPLPPDALYLTDAEWHDWLAAGPTFAFSPFRAPEGIDKHVDLGGRPGRDFADARANPDIELFDAVRDFIAGQQKSGQQVLVAAYTAGSRERLAQLLRDHGIKDVETLPPGKPPEATAETVLVAALPLERGFGAGTLTILAEQDILGDRLVRAPKRRRKSDAFLTELSSLSEGDFVVHEEHGIGQYDGLETLDVVGAPHDCLRVVYEGGDKLYVPVENMEMLSRYGGEEGGVSLDKLGGAGWQARKAKVKARIKEIADKLIKVAAERLMKSGEKLPVPEGLYQEFAARFPYAETDDQARAIEDVVNDLSSGRPMDRLICGDVGFGKTEVALRAAFVAAMNGAQVALIAPTTLLARQHAKTFEERFRGLPLRIGTLSRLTGSKEAAAVRDGVANGEVDIVIGTHALLSKSLSFKRLGLLIVDEEQHFGVAQKERLKALRADVHVLTLTATPIPRTLQMALAGVRDLSLIATPPVDRLAVRTFVLPYDPVVIKEAVMREVFRGGQVFYVCPRIADLDQVAERLRNLVPDVRFAIAHGQMSGTELETVMGRFYDGEVQILLSTNIVESGLDIPSANTLIVHRADRFGLAQLYQLRGRVGRSKTRAYAYLTLPPQGVLGETARRRLEVMQTLDHLGAGFTLASHDMDIRGAGNLLGEEQSGHIKEVGVELYQRLLEEAVAQARSGGDGAGTPETGEAGVPEEAAWTPQIAIGMPVLIPEEYVSDLSVRLGLYRRIAELVDEREIDAFAAELADRFGPLPPEVDNLLRVITIKRLCRAAAVEKIDAGPKGAVLSFREDSFPNPAGLVQFIAQQAGTVKLRPDHKLVYRRQWDDATARVKGISYLMKQLADVAEKTGKAA